VHMQRGQLLSADMELNVYGGKWRRISRNGCIMLVGQEKRELQQVNNSVLIQ